MIQELAVGITLTGSFALVILVILWEFKRREAKLQRQAELSHRVLERFGSAEEISAFLQTEAGRRFLDPSPRGPSNPKQRIIASVEGGAITGMMGLAFLFVAAKHEHEAIWAAMFFLGLGAGLLVSAYVGYRLSRKWGIFNDGEKR
jgi:hypothetical protein